MSKYLVTFDFTKFQPEWNQRYNSTFGPNNEGFIAQGATPKEAISKWNEQLRPGDRLNPFYLNFLEIPE